MVCMYMWCYMFLSHHPSIPLVKQVCHSATVVGHAEWYLTCVSLVSKAKTNASSSRGAAHKSSDRDGVKQELDQ
ncbi:hypothetical protein GQ600_13711 [Phytophthora cactorum]|nr:hypothetical protein GQ600_13711 [Phytophthora cactorum]